MPGTMFQEVVSPRASIRRSWYTLPLSFLAHTTVIVILVVVPLIATDVLLPTPRTALEYITSNFTPIVPAPPPPAPRTELASPQAPHVGPVAPVVAPDGIGAESALIFDPGTIATGNIDNVVRGLGAAESVIELPPLVSSQPPPVRTGGAIQPPARTRYVAPEYPEIARQSRIKGTVIIEAIIGTNGKVENVRVLRSVPLLDGAAVAAVRAWEYTPTLLNGVATPVIMTVTVRFDLN